MEQIEDIFASEALPLGPSNSSASKRLKPIHIFFDEEPAFSDSEDEAEWAKHITSIQPNTSSLQSPYKNDEKEMTNDIEPTLVLNEVLKLCCKNCACCKKIQEYLGTLQMSGTLLKSPSLASEDSGFATSNSNDLGNKFSLPNKEALPTKINIITCDILEPQRVLENVTVNQKRYSLREKNTKLNPSITNIDKKDIQNIPVESQKNSRKEVTEICKRSHQNNTRPKRVTKKPTELSNKKRNILRPSVILNIPKFSEKSPVDGEDSCSSSDPFAEDEKFYKHTEHIWHNDLEKRNTDSREFVQKETKKSTERQRKRLMSNKERTKLVDQSIKDNENIFSAHSDTDEEIIRPRKLVNHSQKRKEPEYSRRRSEPSNAKRRYTDRRLSNVPIDTTAHGNLDKALARKLARTGGLFSSLDSKISNDKDLRSFKTQKSKVRKLYSSDEWLSSQEFLSQFENPQ